MIVRGYIKMVSMEKMNSLIEKYYNRYGDNIRITAVKPKRSKNINIFATDLKKQITCYVGMCYTWNVDELSIYELNRWISNTL